MHRCAWLLSLVLAALRIGDVADFALAETPGPGPGPRPVEEKHSRHVGAVPKLQISSSPQPVFCASDRECPKRHFCPSKDHRHANSLGPPPLRCSPCKKRGKRCYRNQMCCPGNTCHHYVCSPVVHMHSVLYSRLPYPQQQQKPQAFSLMRRRGSRAHNRPPQVKGACVRSSDCGPGECCARWLWVRVCKSRPKAGEVCVSNTRRKEMRHLDLYQRCPCDTGLSCLPRSHTHSHHTHHARSQGHTHSNAAAEHTHKHAQSLSQHTKAQLGKVTTQRLHTCQMNKL